MTRRDDPTTRPPSTRLFLDAALATGAEVALAHEQANYLVNVLRLGPGATVLVFNGRDGEFVATIAEATRKACRVVVGEASRPPQPPPDVHYLFAPLKHARLDYMVQKAAEMGAGALRPVITERTQATRVNLDRMRANVVEACEQCGIVAAPEVREPAPLAAVLDRWAAEEPGRRLVFCDEAAASGSPLATLAALPPGPLAVLIGPEGGFSPAERRRLLAHPGVVPISLGPRILRADTAAVAALALVGAAVAGLWGTA